MRALTTKCASVFIPVVSILLSILHAEDVPTNYIAYSLEELKIGDRAGTTGEGLVGSKANVLVGSDAIVHGSIVAKGNIQLFDRSIVYGNATSGGTVIKYPGATVTGTTRQYAQVTVYTIPSRTFSTGTQDIHVNNDDSAAIDAGNYDTIRVLDRGKLRLNNGIYNVKAFILGDDVKLYLDFPENGGIEVNASQTLVMGDRLLMSFSSRNNPAAVEFYSNGTSEVAVGYDGVAYGTFTAPNAKIIIHDRTSFSGAVYGKRVELQPSIFFAADTIYPQMQLGTPVPGSMINDNTPRIAIWYDDDKSGIDTRTFQVSINGTDYTSQFQTGSDTAWWQVPAGMALPQGTITVISYIEDRAGNAIENTASFTVDTAEPVMTIVSPINASITNNDTPLVKITYSDGLSGILVSSFNCTLDGTDISNRFTVTIDSAQYQILRSQPIVEGNYTLIVSISDNAGNQKQQTIAFTVDLTPPVVTITSPPNGTITNQNPIPLSWTVDDAVQTTHLTENLVEGMNIIVRTATDAAGNTGMDSIVVTLDTQAPVVAITSPADGSIFYQSPITITWTVDGIEQTTETSQNLTEGENVITRSFTDEAGNVGSAIIHVTLQTQGVQLPPDPATVAPQLSTTSFTDMKSATEFLYTGEDPIQTGVDPNAIEPIRAAVIRGKVLSLDGNPLPGVGISVHGHPEFGQTLSRINGIFDLAVNGGGSITINYEKETYFTVQRLIDVPWQDYTTVPDVIMLQPDNNVTPVSLLNNSQMQIARETVSSDNSGTRQATVLFPPGIQVTNYNPDTINVRATEYTVGENGPQAMPAELPFGVGYTYCVDLSVDGAENVEFNQPVYLYVENFLNFPAGGIVPTAYYDRTIPTCSNNTNTAWVPSQNGRIITIIGIEDNKALIDVDGNGVAADSAALFALGITDEERVTLASLYSPDQSLWRVPVTHFSFWDLNWGIAPPEDATPPDQPDPETDELTEDPCTGGGSIIEIQNQVLRESVEISGTPFSINYSSERVPGRTASNSIRIPLTGISPPSSLRKIYLEIYVAGKTYSDTFDVTPELKYTFTWDGYDCYDRKSQGKQRVVINIGYVYDGVYMEPVPLSRSFGLLSAISMTGDLSRQQFVLWQKQQIFVGHWDNKEYSVGGWTLDIHHIYDRTGRVISLGNGERKSDGNMSPVINVVAGNGIPGYSGDGGPATQAAINGIEYLAKGPDGSLYFANQYEEVIRRIDQNGIITTIAGNGERGYSGDGGPATQARLYYPSSIATGPDGSVYFVDMGNNRIRKVCPDGIITTIAGNGVSGYSGDGGPATQASMVTPSGMAVSSNGAIYIADYDDNRVRRIGPDGIITTFAGTGESGFSGDGGPATLAAFHGPCNIAIGPDGSVYITDFYNGRIRRVGPDGIITTIAGNGESGLAGNGGPATQAALNNPYGIAFGPNGSIYVSEMFRERIRQISPDGIITTITGNEESDFFVNGTPAAATSFGELLDIEFGPDGNLYAPDADKFCIVKISSPLFSLSRNNLQIPSEDGLQLFHFNDKGTHLYTSNTLTGDTIYSFCYNNSGSLDSVKDADGNVTVIERDVNGNPTAIVGPYGQRTTLTLNNDGYLSSITNPESETIGLTYSNDGLLAAFTDPKNNTSTFLYDTLGRLIRDTDARGGYTALGRYEIPNGYEVRDTSAEGVVKIYRVQTFADGTKRREVQGCCGVGNTTIIHPDGMQVTTFADSTVVTTKYGPDPRFGMLAPVKENMTIRTPAGISFQSSSGRTVVIDSITNALKTLTYTDTINGQVFTAIYNDSTHTITSYSPSGRYISATLDSLGRVVRNEVNDILPVNFTYNEHGRLTGISQGEGGDARISGFTYNSQGYIETILNALNQSDGYTYDLAGRITDIVLANGLQAGYAYDNNGNITGITPPGKPVHEFEYSSVNLVNTYSPPSVEPGDNATHYSYNLDRQLTGITRPDGLSLQFSYNSLGKITGIQFPEDTLRYVYHDTTNNLIGVSNGDADLGWEYDGSLPTVMDLSGAVNGSITLSYNNDFRVSSLSINGGDLVNYSYDADGVISEAGSMTISRYPNGKLNTTALDNITDSSTYNGFGDCTAYTARYMGTDIFSIEYTGIDKLGRITERTETFEGVARSWQYTYDAVGQLTDVYTDGVLSSHYDYDGVGNRTGYTGSGGTITASYDDQDRLLTCGVNSYTYTANGELETKTDGSGTTLYSYDVLGNLKMVTLPDGTVIEYIVDGMNRQVGKEVNGTLVSGFIYKDQLCPVAQLDNAGNVVSAFVYGTKINVPDYMVRGGITYKIISDHLGSPRIVIDAETGQIMQRMDFDEFGNVTLNTNPGFQPFGFAGGLYDTQTGLVRFGARDYEAETGRWTCKDPIGFEGGDENLYRYVLNRPISLVDPFGLQCGPGPIGDLLIPDGIPGIYDFSDACGCHDECYETAGKTKVECDMQFHENMYKSCKGDPLCESIAEKYFSAVRDKGERFYDKAQSKTRPPLNSSNEPFAPDNTSTQKK